MKRCNMCEQDLPLGSFRFKNKEKTKLQGYCIECNKEYSRQHYQSNKKDYYDKAKRWDAIQYDKILDYLRNNPCVDCGETDIVCLEFDHRDRATKTVNISGAIRKGWGWGKTKEEIDKCDVRCRNCHARVTAKQFGWRKLLGPVE